MDKTLRNQKLAKLALTMLHPYSSESAPAYKKFETTKYTLAIHLSILGLCQATSQKHKNYLAHYRHPYN